MFCFLFKAWRLINQRPAGNHQPLQSHTQEERLEIAEDAEPTDEVQQEDLAISPVYRQPKDDPAPAHCQRDNKGSLEPEVSVVDVD